eukprot:CAMPEP_0185703738 /NCGR_PEP_ID=MMETSP1164-20130828/15395_1 /TAXON_ID=1104430 /ORGANISM="Chrysoreinhardia sp, Strain CCMP2950" /LENGTH=37 /DNA_ID= /DNA_START= /DNA_END= /DNA_ORIENTATION=
MLHADSDHAVDRNDDFGTESSEAEDLNRVERLRARDA